MVKLLTLTEEYTWRVMGLVFLLKNNGRWRVEQTIFNRHILVLKPTSSTAQIMIGLLFLAIPHEDDKNSGVGLASWILPRWGMGMVRKFALQGKAWDKFLIRCKFLGQGNIRLPCLVVNRKCQIIFLYL